MNDQLFIRDAITYSIPKKIMKALLINCLRVDIPDINDKAEVVKELVLPLGFDEIGTGTNRIAFYFNGVVFKIAMDRRGLIDNYMEFHYYLQNLLIPLFLHYKLIKYNYNHLLHFYQHYNT